MLARRALVLVAIAPTAGIHRLQAGWRCKFACMHLIVGCFGCISLLWVTISLISLVCTA
jgi:hypothetical protein